MTDRPSDRYRAMREEAIADFAAGKSLRSIAMRMGIGTATVSRWHVAWQKGKRPTEPGFSRADDDRLCAMFFTYSLQEIADALGKTFGAVRHRARVLGLSKADCSPQALKSKRITSPAPGVTIHRLLG